MRIEGLTIASVDYCSSQKPSEKTYCGRADNPLKGPAKRVLRSKRLSCCQEYELSATSDKSFPRRWIRLKLDNIVIFPVLQNTCFDTKISARSNDKLRSETHRVFITIGDFENRVL